LLRRWTEAGLLETAQADSIRSFEARHTGDPGLRWPVLLALGLGALLLAAGICLFVAAHWDGLSPAERFFLMLLVVASLHGSAAGLAGRFANLSIALHTVGTVALGAGIYLTGQTFNLQSHWPAAVLLWAVGAAAAWGVLRQWPQAVLTAILLPVWLSCEWLDATDVWSESGSLLVEGLLLLAVTYLTAHGPSDTSVVRIALARLGSVALIPLAAALATVPSLGLAPHGVPVRLWAAGLVLAFLGPLAIAVVLRGRRAWMNVVAALWILATGSLGRDRFVPSRPPPNAIHWAELTQYGLYALGSIGLIAWGLAELRRDRVNLGVAGFAITVVAFYFSAVMDMLSRSASLIGFGVLFLAGGWALETTRRRLLERIRVSP